MNLEKGLDLKALVDSLSNRPIPLLVCYLVREMAYKCHLGHLDQVDSFRDLLDQHLKVPNKVWCYARNWFIESASVNCHK